MHFIARLDPFQIDEPRGKILRRVLPDAEIFIRREHPKRAPSVAAARKRAREKVKIIKRVSARGEKRPDVFGKPERSEDIHEGLIEVPGKVALGDEHRDVFRQAVVSPDLKNMAHQLRLPVEIAPDGLARLERV